MKTLLAIFWAYSAFASSIPAWAALTCNAGGADPHVCKSADDAYEILISQNRDITGIGIGTTVFCNRAYLKINGIELNGPFPADVPEGAEGIDYAEGVSSMNGVTARNPATHASVNVDTAIGFVLSDRGVNMLKPQDRQIHNGALLVNRGGATATLVLSNYDQTVRTVQMTCDYSPNGL